MSERLAKGQGYTTISKSGPGKVIHSSLRCRSSAGPMRMDSTSVYEEDGELRITHRGLERTVTWCTYCPVPLDVTWHDHALCWDTDQDFFTHVPKEQAKLIELYCDDCPVIVECFEAEANNPERIGGIWGGVHFKIGRGAKRMEDIIETHRLRLKERFQ